MLAVSRDTVRLFLHVLAATIWVGGQLTLAVVPVLRRFGAEVPRAAARRFSQVAWIAFAVLVATGAWNIATVHGEMSHDASYRVTLTHARKRPPGPPAVAAGGELPGKHTGARSGAPAEGRTAAGDNGQMIRTLGKDGSR